MEALRKNGGLNTAAAQETTETPAPAAGAGAPARTPAGRQVYRYAKPWRKTGLGGMTYHIAWCNTCQAIVSPVSFRRSRSGTHGEDYWLHEHPLAFIRLVSSNSGRRELSCEGEVPEWLRIAAEDAWLWRRLRATETDELLFNLAREMKAKGGSAP